MATVVWDGYIEPAFGQRLLARAIDTVPFFALFMVVYFVGSPWTMAAAVLAAIYEVVMVAWRGQTFGKMAMDIRVVDVETGETPTPAQALARWLAFAGPGALRGLVPRLPAPYTAVYDFVVLVPILKAPYHRGVHDWAARTIVTACTPIEDIAPGPARTPVHHAQDGRTVWEGYIEPTFGQRLLARVVDGVLFTLVASAMAQQLDERTWATACMVLVALYETGTVAWRGQTLGKTVLNIRVVDVETGDTPAPIQAFVRWLTVAAAGVFALVMPAAVTPTIAAVYALVILVPLLKPPYHRGVHDRIAGTLVTAAQVRVPSDRPGGSRHPAP